MISKQLECSKIPKTTIRLHKNAKGRSNSTKIADFEQNGKFDCSKYYTIHCTLSVLKTGVCVCVSMTTNDHEHPYGHPIVRKRYIRTFFVAGRIFIAVFQLRVVFVYIYFLVI